MAYYILEGFIRGDAVPGQLMGLADLDPDGTNLESRPLKPTATFAFPSMAVHMMHFYQAGSVGIVREGNVVVMQPFRPIERSSG